MALTDSSNTNTAFGEPRNGGSHRIAGRGFTSGLQDRRLEERTFPFCLLPAHYFDRAAVASRQSSLAQSSLAHETSNGSGSIDSAGLIVQRW